MSRLLFLGASVSQVPAIRYARSRGHYVVACDADPAAVGFPLCDARAVVDFSDVDKVAAALKEKGVRFEQYDNMPGATRDGDIHVMGEMRAAWFKDPDGNILNIVNRMG